MANDNHMWVEFTYVPITVELAEDGQSLNIYASEEGLDAADDAKMMGCWFCHEPLTFSSFSTECQGAPDKKVDEVP
mgnify:CR=1 FL=1